MQLISELIKPEGSGFTADYSSAGEPCLPIKFKWRKKVFELAAVLSKSKKISKCKHGADEQYVRKHIYKIKTRSGEVMNISFDRQPRSHKKRFDRWFLVSIE